MDQKSHKPFGPQLAYNCSVGAGVLLVAGGFGILYGVGWAMVSAGALMLILAIFAAERLTRSRPRVLDRNDQP